MRWRGRAIAAAMLADPAAPVALLDREARLVRAGPALEALTSGVLAFAEPAAGEVREAVRRGTTLTARASW